MNAMRNGDRKKNGINEQEWDGLREISSNRQFAFRQSSAYRQLNTVTANDPALEDIEITLSI